MSNLVKLFLAIVLGVVAAGINWIWLTSKDQPPQFVAVKQALDRNDEITSEVLKPVGIPGSLDNLRRTLIPYEDRSILLGLRATRPYAEGDMIFYRDIRRPVDGSHYEHLGPFRLISVGQRFANSVKTGEDQSAGSRGNILTIAAPLPYDEKTLRLLDIVGRTRENVSDEDDSQPQETIVAIEVYPVRNGEAPRVASQSSEEAFRLPLKEDEVALFISLEGIENVPRVLLVGDEIGFVVPTPMEY